MSVSNDAYDQRALRELFDACDPSRSGFISKASLLEGSKRLGIEDLTDEMVDQMFAELDDESEGQVSFDCFAERFTAWSQQTVSGERNETEDAVLDSDLRRLVELYEVDPTGVSLHRFLVSEWRWPRSAADQVVQTVNPAMTPEIVAKALKAFLVEPASPSVPRALNTSSVDSGLEMMISPAKTSRSHSAPAPLPGKLFVSVAQRDERSRDRGKSATLSNLSGTESELDSHFPSLKGHREIVELWENIRATKPELLGTFSNFLDNVSQQLHEAEVQHERMRSDMLREVKQLDQRAKELDEEAMTQIEVERDLARRQERDRVERLRRELRKEMEDRDRNLEAAMHNLKGLQTKLEQETLRGQHIETQYEELKQHKNSLERELQLHKLRQKDLEQQMESSGQESSSRPPEKPQTDSENEVLLLQLDRLRKMNMELQRQLQDRNDELQATEQRHQRYRIASTTSNSRWYDDDEDWRHPFQGEPLAIAHRRRPPSWISDDDASPQPHRPKPRRPAALIVPGRRYIRHHRRLTTQSPVPSSMDRYLRRWSVSNVETDDEDLQRAKEIAKTASPIREMAADRERQPSPTVSSKVEQQEEEEGSGNESKGRALQTARQSSSECLVSARVQQDEQVFPIVKGRSPLPSRRSSSGNKTSSLDRRQVPSLSDHLLSGENPDADPNVEVAQFFPHSAPLHDSSFLTEGSAFEPYTANDSLQQRPQAVTLVSDTETTVPRFVAQPGASLFKPITPATAYRRGLPMASTPEDNRPPRLLRHGTWAGQQSALAGSEVAPRRKTKSGRRYRYSGSHRHGIGSTVSQPVSGWNSPLFERSMSPTHESNYHGLPSRYSPSDRYRPSEYMQHGQYSHYDSPPESPLVSDFVKYPASSYQHPPSPTRSISPFENILDSPLARTHSLQPRSGRGKKYRSEARYKHPKVALSRTGINASWTNLSSAEQIGGKLEGRPDDMPVVYHPIQAEPVTLATRNRPISPTLVRRIGVVPERVFKVVFCGDLGVGKTSYIWRLCNETAEFSGHARPTVGVDFKMKVLEVDGHMTVMQMWDTAGQERYSTFAKQYFRRADGVICVYDLTDHRSFSAMNSWIAQIQEATEGRVAMMILGNKNDIADVGPRPQRQVTYWQGQKLAQSSAALFAEVSARTGHGVLETCIELAKVLHKAEKEMVSGLLSLDRRPKSKQKSSSCCS